MVGWLGLCASNAGDADSISGGGTRILHAMWQKEEKDKHKYREQTSGF